MIYSRRTILNEMDMNEYGDNRNIEAMKGELKKNLEQMSVLNKDWDEVDTDLQQAYSDQELIEKIESRMETIRTNIKEVANNIESLESSLKKESVDQFKEWVRLSEQEDMLYKELSEKLDHFTKEEYEVVLKQIKEVHDRRNELSAKLDKEGEEAMAA